MNIPFIKFNKFGIMISSFLILVTLISLLFKGLNLGLDFTGGISLEVKYEQKADLERIRNSISKIENSNFVVLNYGSDNSVLIKFQSDEELSINAQTVIDQLSTDNYLGTVEKSETIFPQIGEELRDQGGLGMVVALFMILMYVAFRFQYKFALGAVTALAHDVVIILGLFSIFGWDFDLTVLAALLAVIGYSLNDTIVVSDRIRENFRTERVLEPIDLIDLSLNQTLGRTLVTSFTTLLVLFALFIFGGELIKGFSLALIIGVLIGTYSSIYVVANMLMSLTLTQDDLALPEPEGADFDGMP